MNQEKEIMTIEQTADYLQLTIATIRLYISEGLLPATKLGKQWRIQKKDIISMLDKNKNTNQSIRDTVSINESED